VLTAILASTEQLSVGKTQILPGRKSDVQSHAGDESLYVLAGTLNVHLPENEGTRWFELHPRDGFFTPEGTAHQYYNMSDRPVEFIYGVAPGHS
jgi:quercetin dioxygenase-like cupin family protein